MLFQILEWLSVLGQEIVGDLAHSKCLQKLPFFTIKFCNMIRRNGRNAMVNRFLCSFSAQLPGARALLTRCADVIAGHTVCRNEAKRVRDMRKYPFWARFADCFEILRFIAPRKILRDSPTRRDTPKKTSANPVLEAGLGASNFFWR
jgi:hypothetical protein